MTKKVTPNFFIVGQPKSGTSSIHLMLGQHPEIFMSHDKEPLYFSKDFTKEAMARSKHFQYKFKYNTIDDYAALFSSAMSYKIRGESTTHYLYSKVAAFEIQQVCPDARIVILLRNPIDFLQSYHSQLVVQGLENEFDFQKAMQLEPFRKCGQKIPRNMHVPSFLFYTERVKYAQQIQRFINVFGRHQVMIIIYEDFKLDNIGVLKDIAEFLDIDNSFEPKPININIGKSPRSRLLNMIIFNPAFKHALKTLLPQKVLTNPLLKKTAKSIFWEKSNKKLLPEDFHKGLYGMFHQEVEKASDLLGYDLVHKWCFNKY